MQIHYFIREYSEGFEFPEAHMFTTEAEARQTMIAEAYDAAQTHDGFVCIPGCDDEPLAREDVPEDVTGLDVEWEGGGFDCFRLKVQEVEKPARPFDLTFTRNDTEGQLAVIWDALAGFREDCIPEGEELYNAQWDEITTAMAFITEDLEHSYLLPEIASHDVHMVGLWKLDVSNNDTRLGYSDWVRTKMEHEDRADDGQTEASTGDLEKLS
ncbi:hypothetical protein [Palleronia sp.]|uniref:hypothetical protein n=1 Tax=Palleronia sp. TaxID=1940284 RepID=UPI0035C81623